MKPLDSLDAGSTIIRHHPVVVLSQIREATRPGILRSQRRARRRVARRRMMDRAGYAFLCAIGFAGITLAIGYGLAFAYVMYTLARTVQ